MAGFARPKKYKIGSFGRTLCDQNSLMPFFFGARRARYRLHVSLWRCRTSHIHLYLGLLSSKK